MNFRSVAQLSDQILTWSSALPHDLDVIVGVPRSGLLAANLLALYRNLPMTDVEGLLEGRCIATGSARGPLVNGAASKHDPKRVLGEPRNVLVLDDSVGSGKTMQEIRERIGGADLPHRVQYAAVYVSPSGTDAVDFYCEAIHFPRLFEWNALHHGVLGQSCLDMDGVLCYDPTYEENDDGERYLTFLREARPLHRPTARVGWIV
ncbi:MAG: phosphoribosyltransferase family protein, partial [Rhodothermales bacterium]|nr:phosphoribosyltransferase family protein [Rhodothermales bacterium]